jgi:hypothetical protein
MRIWALTRRSKGRREMQGFWGRRRDLNLRFFVYAVEQIKGKFDRVLGEEGGIEISVFCGDLGLEFGKEEEGKGVLPTTAKRHPFPFQGSTYVTAIE